MIQTVWLMLLLVLSGTAGAMENNVNQSSTPQLVCINGQTFYVEVPYHNHPHRHYSLQMYWATKAMREHSAAIKAEERAMAEARQRAEQQKVKFVGPPLPLHRLRSNLHEIVCEEGMNGESVPEPSDCRDVRAIHQEHLRSSVQKHVEINDSVQATASGQPVGSQQAAEPVQRKGWRRFFCSCYRSQDSAVQEQNAVTLREPPAFMNIVLAPSQPLLNQTSLHSINYGTNAVSSIHHLK